MEVDVVLRSCRLSMPREQWPSGHHAVRYVNMPVSVITTWHHAFIHLEGSIDHWPRTNKQIGLCWSQDFIGDWVGFDVPPPWGVECFMGDDCANKPNYPAGLGQVSVSDWWTKYHVIANSDVWWQWHQRTDDCRQTLGDAGVGRASLLII
jgi:hypothetical protein